MKQKTPTKSLLRVIRSSEKSEVGNDTFFNKLVQWIEIAYTIKARRKLTFFSTVGEGGR